MKIVFFSPRSIAPLHPRLVLYEQFFLKMGIDIKFINKSDSKNKLISRINWLTLWFTDLYAVKRCKPFVIDADIVFVADAKYLPLTMYAKKLNKIVIYETIDHNVYLRYYQLKNKFKILSLFKKVIVSWFIRMEKRYTTYCDEILVNSDSLRTYFDKNAHTLYYYSPFEKIAAVNEPTNPLALLYLGGFSNDKGAHQILDLQKKLNVPLFIFGNVVDAELNALIKEVQSITHVSKISIPDLEENLAKLLEKFYLVGFSLIHAVHFSYEVQEANKDIDYLAMGIPLLGNYRLPTKEKIDARCGLFFDDQKLSEKITDVKIRSEFTTNCKKYYALKYSSSHFEGKLKEIINKYL